MTAAQSREQLKAMVKDAADIVQVVGEHVELKRAGSRFSGLCPFHSEKTPSFSVNPQGQFYHCFGCGESGDVLSFVMKYHHMEFPEALKHLAQRLGIELPERQLSDGERAQLRQREALFAANEAAVVVYQECLEHPRRGRTARTYLEQRGVPAEVISRYRLGWAPEPDQAGWSFLVDQLSGQGVKSEILEQVGLAVRKDRGGCYDRFRGRVMFPITDLTGRVAAFGGRLLGDGKPKYMNSPESPIFDKGRLLFGLQQHREAIRKKRRALVVEGNFDLLLLAVHGIENVVAPLGTALSRSHVHTLRGYCDEVILLFDADAAGLKAAMRSIPFFLAEQVEGRVALLPAGHDPDSFVRAEGSAAVDALVAGARPLAEFAFDTLVGEHGLTLAGKSRIAAELKRLLAEAADPEQRALMVAHFSNKLGVSGGYFQLDSGRRKVKQPSAPAAPPSALANLPRQERQVVDFLLRYPEYWVQLAAAGLEETIQEPAAASLLRHIKTLAEQGAVQPEQLLALPLEEEQRHYVVELLTRVEPYAPEERQDEVERMGEELRQWLLAARQRQDGADLQEQIRRAEQLGQTEQLMELLRRKQEMERKRISFSFNLLKND